MRIKPESGQATENKPTILVVDDEAGPRDALKVILRPFYEIVAAENAQAALDVLSTHSVDLITLDQKLPDRQGFDLLQDIKRTHSDIEVIIITGYGSLKSAMEGIRQGAAGYLLKPFNVTELITLINQTLQKKQRLDFLRNFIHATPQLWGSEQDSARAWAALRSTYRTLRNVDGGDPTASQKHDELLSLLSDMLEAKDRQLLNHSSRVSFYATLLANRLNLGVSEQKALAMGAFLHDIGKLSMTPYRFCDDQMLPSRDAAGCREHPDIGARMILPLGFPAEVGQIVSYHHEWWNGSGYPNGLQGEGIPLLAQVVGIAQVFDHLTADVPGRAPLSVDEAVQEIARRAQTQFDPALVSLFTQVLHDCKASLPAMAIASPPARHA